MDASCIFTWRVDEMRPAGMSSETTVFHHGHTVTSIHPTSSPLGKFVYPKHGQCSSSARNSQKQPVSYSQAPCACGPQVLEAPFPKCFSALSLPHPHSGLPFCAGLSHLSPELCTCGFDFYPFCLCACSLLAGPFPPPPLVLRHSPSHLRVHF